MAKITFSRRFLEDFCEADERLFKILREKQDKIYADILKRKAKKANSLYLLLISNPADEDFNFETVCHLAIETDTAKPGENYRPALYAVCGTSSDYLQKAGKADKLLRALRNDLRNIRLFLNQGTFLCQKCKEIGKLPAKRRQEQTSKLLHTTNHLTL